jgi:hypothetical protein
MLIKELMAVLAKHSVVSKILFSIHRTDSPQSSANLAVIESVESRHRLGTGDLMLTIANIEESRLLDGTSRITINLKIA